jgi:lipopolysaccharide transport system ATP-binding protein
MKTTIHFENVSKQYKLGLTRTSVPSLISNYIKKSFNSSNKQAENQILWALRDVNFELKQGESLALVGSNGAGKTTILKLLANITKPSSGNITVDGNLSALIELGAGFHPDLTGRENIFLNGTILGLSRKEISRRFDEIVAFSELERFIDTPVKRYSSGMIVRLGFAVASSIEPEILLVDEVLAVGDAAFQQKCLKRIRALVNDGTSIIFVSHNFYLVQAVCDRALYLEHGQVKQFGLTKDVIDQYEQDLHQARARKFEAVEQDAGNGDEDVEITRVEVLNSDGEPCDVYASSQPVQVRAHYHAYKPLGKVHASIFLIRSDGLTCCMIRTKLDKFDLFMEQGIGTITLNLEPLQLVSGTYFAEAWILNESDSMTLSAKAGRSEWFTVKGSALSYEESSGVYEANGRWYHASGEENRELLHVS